MPKFSLAFPIYVRELGLIFQYFKGGRRTRAGEYKYFEIGPLLLRNVRFLCVCVRGEGAKMAGYRKGGRPYISGGGKRNKCRHPCHLALQSPIFFWKREQYISGFFLFFFRNVMYTLYVIFTEITTTGGGVGEGSSSPSNRRTANLPLSPPHLFEAQPSLESRVPAGGGLKEERGGEKSFFPKSGGGPKMWGERGRIKN